MIGRLHRQVWQRLPYDLRRSLLFRTTSLMAPRARTHAPAVAPIVVAGALRAASGLGRSARLCLDALQMGGADVAALDLTVPLRQPVTIAPSETPEAAPGPGTLILHVNAPLTGMALLAIGRRRLRGKRIIGYWAWELPEVPDEWRLGVGLVHEIWVPSAFTAAAIRPIAGDRPVHVVPHPVLVDPAPPGPGRRERAPFTVLCMFDAASSIARKNPEGAIAAFRRAFGEDRSALLLLKTQRLDTVPEERARLAALADAPNIRLLDATLDARGMDALYGKADVVISLHRAEGFGLSLAEAMRRGLPVIATDWSGSVDFVSREVGIPIPFRLVPAEDSQRTYDHPSMSWAEPDVDAAAAALRVVREDPALRARLGAAGADYAASHWDARAYCARLRELGLPVAGR